MKLSLYIGAGWAHAYSRPHTNSATFNAGIINRFRLSNAVDLNLGVGVQQVWKASLTENMEVNPIMMVF